MNTKKAIENLNRIKSLGIFMDEEEYDRLVDEVTEIDKRLNKPEPSIKEIDELIAIKEIENLLK
jgi:hypothetical protein